MSEAERWVRNMQKVIRAWGFKLPPEDMRKLAKRWQQQQKRGVLRRTWAACGRAWERMRDWIISCLDSGPRFR